ncbi:hypothetical protein BACCELL_01192 [Bacteroides cellulosilyticus DSM 14838]|uniref:Uncharacterized protein n=1 Tax=Bacteroides cellulosilyticus DSM 14838 TaxID=537012 RepID=E2NA89_9BACE|nr:hypothetical protein BACCELL_01192 [Bacteroides cellulosilyticus DSM 14838]
MHIFSDLCIKHSIHSIKSIKIPSLMHILSKIIATFAPFLE